MRFYDFSSEKRKEYMRRIRAVKATHPGVKYPSEKYWNKVTYCLSGTGIQHIKNADEMGSNDDLLGVRKWILSRNEPNRDLIKKTLPYLAPLGDTKLCDKVFQTGLVDIDAKDDKGNTGLMNAVERKRLGTAEWLLQHGAKILPNKAGWNPVLLACWQGCIPALNMFKYYGVDFTLPFSRLEWKNGLPSKHLDYPIEIALLSNQTKVVEWLFNNGVSVNDKMEKGYSVRQMFAVKPEYFTQEIKEIVMKKMFDESKKSLEEIQKTGKKPQPKKTFFQRLFSNRTKE